MINVQETQGKQKLTFRLVHILSVGARCTRIRALLFPDSGQLLVNGVLEIWRQGRQPARFSLLVRRLETGGRCSVPAADADADRRLDARCHAHRRPGVFAELNDAVGQRQD